MTQRSDIPVEEVLDACHVFHRQDGPDPWKALSQKYPGKVVLARLEQLVDQGWLDFGTSVRTAWIKTYDPEWPGHALGWTERYARAE